MRAPGPLVIKPGEPGSTVEFVEDRDGQSISRSGVVWAKGPVPASVWVQPDDDPANQVLVKLPPKTRSGTARVIPGYPANWQRNVIRRCDAVSRHGGLFGAVDKTTPSYGYDRRGIQHVTWHITWHADGACPDAVNKPRYVSDGAQVHVPAGAVVDFLMGRPCAGSYWSANLCRRCVFLTESGAVAGAA